jgi:(p)ppGpp synthase/HD superfamily hydrolase
LRAVTGTGRWRQQELGALPKTRAALAFARRQHAGQLRTSDGGPFIEHPIEVSRLLYRVGAADHVIAAGLLHDILEKTEVTAAELRSLFGTRISRLVAAVSEDEQISGYVRRKEALRRQVSAAGPDALAVFAADKVSKVGELRVAVWTAAQRHQRVDPSIVRPRRLIHFRRCLGLLEDRYGDSPLVERLHEELTLLSAELRSFPVLSAAA